MKDQPVPLPSIFGVLESTEFENTSILQQKTVVRRVKNGQLFFVQNQTYLMRTQKEAN